MTTDKIKVPNYVIIIIVIIIMLLPLVINVTAVYLIAKRLVKDNTSTPVEDVVRVDSIIRENNNTKIIIEHLNTEKNEQVIKVRNLSNDSTLTLFYELLKEQ